MNDASTRPASLHTYYSYRDAPAALRWLERAFGFTTTLEFPDGNGGIMHAELRREDVAIIVFSDDNDYDRPPVKGETVGHGAYISVSSGKEVDAVYATAVEAGAIVVWTPANTEWGSYRCRVLDLEGYEWTFGTHLPGQDQGDWSEG
ncbi:VOC family protein [Nocardiopsis ansamitocini]|uniref:Glyoxalase n=1 Tax=Nocardiopsis ansamitocini TaxID=1670832 RepID=A0A9W6P5C5_9ACTN|nr:VOC family protein [Nocardiopsis ansamitocini]GLU47368.1 glyoxalase [Nocardiopsis ansamitocini]